MKKSVFSALLLAVAIAFPGAAHAEKAVPQAAPVAPANFYSGSGLQESQVVTETKYVYRDNSAAIKKVSGQVIQLSQEIGTLDSSVSGLPDKVASAVGKKTADLATKQDVTDAENILAAKIDSQGQWGWNEWLLYLLPVGLLVLLLGAAYSHQRQLDTHEASSTARTDAVRGDIARVPNQAAVATAKLQELRASFMVYLKEGNFDYRVHPETDPDNPLQCLTIKVPTGSNLDIEYPDPDRIPLIRTADRKELEHSARRVLKNHPSDEPASHAEALQYQAVEAAITRGVIERIKKNA